MYIKLFLRTSQFTHFIPVAYINLENKMNVLALFRKNAWYFICYS